MSNGKLESCDQSHDKQTLSHASNGVSESRDLSPDEKTSGQRPQSTVPRNSQFVEAGFNVKDVPNTKTSSHRNCITNENTRSVTLDTEDCGKVKIKQISEWKTNTGSTCHDSTSSGNRSCKEKSVQRPKNKSQRSTVKDKKSKHRKTNAKTHSQKHFSCSRPTSHETLLGEHKKADDLSLAPLNTILDNVQQSHSYLHAFDENTTRADESPETSFARLNNSTCDVSITSERLKPSLSSDELLRTFFHHYPNCSTGPFTTVKPRRKLFVKSGQCLNDHVKTGGNSCPRFRKSQCGVQALSCDSHDVDRCADSISCYSSTSESPSLRLGSPLAACSDPCLSSPHGSSTTSDQGHDCAERATESSKAGRVSLFNTSGCYFRSLALYQNHDSTKIKSGGTSSDQNQSTSVLNCAWSDISRPIPIRSTRHDTQLDEAKARGFSIQEYTQALKQNDIHVDESTQTLIEHRVSSDKSYRAIKYHNTPAGKSTRPPKRYYNPPGESTYPLKRYYDPDSETLRWCYSSPIDSVRPRKRACEPASQSSQPLTSGATGERCNADGPVVTSAKRPVSLLNPPGSLNVAHFQPRTGSIPGEDWTRRGEAKKRKRCTFQSRGNSYSSHYTQSCRVTEDELAVHYLVTKYLDKID